MRVLPPLTLSVSLFIPFSSSNGTSASSSPHSDFQNQSAASGISRVTAELTAEHRHKAVSWVYHEVPEYIASSMSSIVVHWTDLYVVGGIHKCCAVDGAKGATAVYKHDLRNFIPGKKEKGSHAEMMHYRDGDGGVRGVSTSAVVFGHLLIVEAANDPLSKAKASDSIYTVGLGFRHSVEFKDQKSVLSKTRLSEARSRSAIVSNRDHTVAVILGGLRSDGEPSLNVDLLWHFGDLKLEQYHKRLPGPHCDCIGASVGMSIVFACNDCSQLNAPRTQGYFIKVSLHRIHRRNVESGSFTIPLNTTNKTNPPSCHNNLLVYSVSSQYALFLEYDCFTSTHPTMHYVQIPQSDGEKFPSVKRFSTEALSGMPNFPASFMWFNRPFVLGGERYGAVQSERGELELDKAALVTVEGPGTSFTIGSSVGMSCNNNGFVGLSAASDCADIGDKFPCTKGNLIEYRPKREEPSVFVCFSRGRCNCYRKHHSISCDASDFSSCINFGCCWDEQHGCYGFDGEAVGHFELASAFQYQFLADPNSSSSILTPRVVAAVTAVMLLLVGFGAYNYAQKRWRWQQGQGAVEPNYTQITERYKVLKKIGAGGFGQVFLVRRREDGMKLALKYIQCNDTLDRGAALREFDSMRQVQGHPNLVEIVDMFMSWNENGTSVSASTPLVNPLLDDMNKKYVCLVMKFFAGGDIADYVKEVYRHEELLSEEWLLLILARQVSKALHHLHNRDVPMVHRDLKPENILVSKDKQHIVLTDFGLAHEQQHNQYLTTRTGSLQYVAPECWARRYGSQIDNWSLGCVLYAAATGRVRQSNCRVMFHDVQKEGFEEQIRKDLIENEYTEEFVTLVLALLVLDPAHRFTAEDTLGWLEEYERNLIHHKRTQSGGVGGEWDRNRLRQHQMEQQMLLQRQNRQSRLKQRSIQQEAQKLKMEQKQQEEGAQRAVAPPPGPISPTGEKATRIAVEESRISKNHQPSTTTAAQPTRTKPAESTSTSGALKTQELNTNPGVISTFDSTATLDNAQMGESYCLQAGDGNHQKFSSADS